MPRWSKQIWITAGASLHKWFHSRGMKAPLWMSYPTLTIWLNACPQGRPGMSWSTHCPLQCPSSCTGARTWATYWNGWWSWGECCPPHSSALASLMGTLCVWPGGCSSRATSWPMTPPAMMREWVPMWGMAEDLSQTEEASDRELSNMVPLDSAEEAQRLD